MQTVSKRQLTTAFTTEADMQPGNVIYDERGSKYAKCKAAAAIAVNETCMIDTTDAVLTRGYYVPTVIRSAIIADTPRVIGFNNTGSAITSGDYFWAKSGPVVDALAGDVAAVVTGSPAYCSGTDGETDDLVTGALSVLGTYLTDAAATTGTTCQILTRL
jgi:hypothetical protein